jgi:hypothetical protein
MKRILLVVSVAALMAAMLAVMSVPAFATIHPLANSECANANASDVAKGQNPPGLTTGGPSQGSPPNNSTGSTLAQPVFSASGGEPLSTERPSPAFKTFGPTLEALDAPYCPDNK